MPQLVAATRTVRRFQQNRALTERVLHGLIDLARLSGSARNAQVLQYMPVLEPALCERIFHNLTWAGYLTAWSGPEPGERPPGYIICLANRDWQKGPDTELYCDVGIASQSMLLAAAEKGVFGCRIGAFKPTLHAQLQLEERHRIFLVLALGYPAEEVVLEDVGAEGDIRYWRDEERVHHVPKRSLQDVMLPPPTVF
ncbi:MAG: nitroreductase [Desulfobulbaceae bacterium]|nr:nitroreductase [Desulfobulbaceae bacterium]